MGALEIKNLSFSYTKERQLFNDFSLTLDKGKIVSIVGESGIGKSTLFELITGELKPHSGHIKSGKVAQVYQDPYSSFHHTYSIKSQIADVASLDGVERYMERLKITDEMIEKKPYELSGGQLQRCSILRALLMKPDVLLVDEPTSALDNITALEVMKLILGFLESSSVLLITHDMDLARWCSDEIVRL